MKKKNPKQQRVSNRTYPPKLCKKPDCNFEFIPTDGRQVYCNAQHRVDSNNDKRKIIDKFESDFNKKARNNERVMKKVINSKSFISSGRVSLTLLEYEGYDPSIYHISRIHEKTKREVKFCFKYGLALSESDKNYFNIIHDDHDDIS